MLTTSNYFFKMNRIDRIQQMLQAAPGDNFLRHALALECIKEGDDEKAKRLFLEILHESPDYVGSYYHLAKLFERSGQTEAAIEWYEKGMKAAKTANDNHSYNELQSAYEELIY